MLVLLLAEGEEAGSSGAVGGGVAPEEEGLASSLLMLGYGELQFDPLPPPMPGLPAPWLSVRPQISQPELQRRAHSAWLAGVRCVQRGGARHGGHEAAQHLHDAAVRRWAGRAVHRHRRHPWRRVRNPSHCVFAVPDVFVVGSGA